MSITASPYLRFQKSLKISKSKCVYVGVKPCVFSIHSYLAFACTTVVSVVTAESKAGTTKAVGCIKPQTAGDVTDAGLLQTLFPLGVPSRL